MVSLRPIRPRTLFRPVCRRPKKVSVGPARWATEQAGASRYQLGQRDGNFRWGGMMGGYGPGYLFGMHPLKRLRWHRCGILHTPKRRATKQMSTKEIWSPGPSLAADPLPRQALRTPARGAAQRLATIEGRASPKSVGPAAADCFHPGPFRR